MLKTLNNLAFTGYCLTAIDPNKKPTVELASEVKYDGLKDTFSKGECTLKLPDDNALKNALDGHQWNYDTSLPAAMFLKRENNYPDKTILSKIDEYLNNGSKPNFYAFGNDCFQKTYSDKNTNDTVNIIVKDNSEIQFAEYIHKPFGIFATVYGTSLDQVKGSAQKEQLKKLIKRVITE